MKRDYTLIDGKLLQAVTGGIATFTGLITAARPEADRIAAEDNQDRKHGYDQIPAWRIVDRRLQALRKAGKIRYLKGKWEIVKDGEVQS